MGQGVIVTAPLGCLKAGQLAFQPALPDWKQAAIAALGYGNLNKACSVWHYCASSCSS